MQLGPLLRRAAPYRGRLLAVSGLSLASSVALLAAPWLAGQVLGDVLAGGSLAIGGVVVLLVAALAASTALSVAAAMVGAHTSGRILRDLRVAAYVHVQHLPMAFHDSTRQGDLLALLTYEVAHLSQFLSTTLASVPAMLLTAAGSLLLLFWLDPMVAVFVPVLVPAFFVALKLVGRRQRQLAQEARIAEAALMSAAEEDLAMLPAIRAFAIEDRRRRNYAGLAETSYALAFRQQRLSAIVGPVIALVAALAVIALLAFAGAGSATGGPVGGATTGADSGELLSLLLYAALLTRPVAALADSYGQLQWARGTLARLEEVLAQPCEPGLATGFQPDPVPAPQTEAAPVRASGALRFENLHFAYPEREPVLRGLTLEIAAGEIVALTGLNGAGKSTLIQLLLRFYEPDRGRILLDGADISALQVQALRRQVALVPQRPLLSAGSIRDNIALGMPDATRAQITAAARLAQADAFISALPAGYDTPIGDHGVRLSGGQQQRIALARALLIDPPLLVFDEATAMFDLAGEEAFIAACQTALRGRTVIIITHRAASLALADRIVRIEDGRAVAG